MTRARPRLAFTPAARVLIAAVAALFGHFALGAPAAAGQDIGPMMHTLPAEPPPATVAVPPPPAPMTTVTAAPTPPANALPPTMFASEVAGDELLNLLRANPRFAQVSKDVVGSPIAIRVSQTFELTAGGTASAFASALLAGSSLGILPMVSNSDHVITYEVVVNGAVLAAYPFKHNFTRVESIYAGTDTTYGLGTEGLAWAKGTVAQFIDATAQDARLAALLEEYRFYFGSAAR